MSRIRKRIPPALLHEMAKAVSTEDRDEMAIPSYLHKNPLLRMMAWHRIDAIAELLNRSLQASGPHSRVASVMDFGCGTGVLFDEISQLADNVIGVDLVLEPAQMLLDEWQIPNVRLLTPDNAHNEIPAGSLDAIVAAEVLEHIENIEDTLAFFHSRLKKSGKLFISVPTENALYKLGRRLAGFDDHYHESNAAVIHANILTNGFAQKSLAKIPAPGPLAIYWVAEYEPIEQIPGTVLR